jgi:hypothetical protein
MSLARTLELVRIVPNRVRWVIDAGVPHAEAPSTALRDQPLSRHRAEVVVLHDKGMRRSPAGWLARIILPGVALALALPLQAQGPARVTRSGSGLWTQFYGKYHFTSRWAVLVGGQLRRANFASEAAQTWLQLGLGYDVTKGGGVTVGAGYVYLHTHPYGAFPAATGYPEHRAWQQLAINTPLGLVGLLQRFQLEQRWIGNVTVRPDGKEFVSAWVPSWRARTMFQATIPFQRRPIGDGDLYGVVADEVFVAFGSNAGPNLFNQNRAYAMLGWQLRHGLRVQTGYMNQIVANASGNQTAINHVLVVSMSHSASLQ